MSIKYNLVSMGDQSNLTLFVNGEMYTADNTHPNWDLIVDGLAKGDERVVALFDVADFVAEEFRTITDRVSVEHGRVYFDGEEIDNSVSSAIIRAMREGEDLVPLAKFLERLMLNPSRRSRENLYDWLRVHDFTITRDGYLVAYKGVMRDSEGNFTSVSTGTAYVDGKRQDGHIPNFVGAVVTMPRTEVMDDPNVACSHGLHAGTWEYANGFGSGGTLKVLIDPADVVSIPSDSGNQKMRCCRYTVVEVLEKPVETVYDDLYAEEDDEWGAEEEWEDEARVAATAAVGEDALARWWNVFTK